MQRGFSSLSVFQLSGANKWINEVVLSNMAMDDDEKAILQKWEIPQQIH